jgi:hypothetical protein
MNNVLTLVPIYKYELSSFELYCLKKSLAALAGRDVRFIGPASLVTIYYSENFPFFQFIGLPDINFSSIENYNRILINKEFYKLFLNYEFLLILQTDAIVLRDDLDFWRAQPFDYIGAPWPDGYEIHVNSGKFSDANGKNIKVYVGNGGLSLRRVRKCISLLNEFDGEILEFFNSTGSSEDLFFSVMGALSNDFIIPNEITASRFSVELKPSYYVNLNDGILPMGGHALLKYEPEFWKNIFVGFNAETDIKK